MASIFNTKYLMHKLCRNSDTLYTQKFSSDDNGIKLLLLLTRVLPDSYSREYGCSVSHKKNTIRNILSNNKCTTAQTTRAITI